MKHIIVESEDYRFTASVAETDEHTNSLHLKFTFQDITRGEFRRANEIFMSIEELRELGKFLLQEADSRD